MPQLGTLRDWHEDRGFGFISPTHGGPEVFVHASAFPRDGSRPVAGERVEYELGRGRDGRPQAVRVVRLAVGTPSAPGPARAGPTRRGRESRGSGNWLSKVTGAVLGLALLAWAVPHFVGQAQRRQLAAQPPAAVAPPADAGTAAPGAFRCDGRTQCSQMTSCEEARWFINHCPGTRMDGNGDGIPCETQWCTGSAPR